MYKPLFRLTLFLTIAFVLLIGAIRAQPYDDGELRAFMFPVGCEQPCVTGIQPGVTTRDEAVAILRAHPWVGMITIETRSARIQWRWNENIPDTIQSEGGMGSVTLNEKGLVDSVVIFTNYPLWEYLIALNGGIPDLVYYKTVLSGLGQSQPYAMRGLYTSNFYLIESSGESQCPPNHIGLLSNPSKFAISQKEKFDLSRYDYYNCQR